MVSTKAVCAVAFLCLGTLIYAAEDVVELGEGAGAGASTFTITFNTKKANRPSKDATFTIKVKQSPAPPA